MRNYSTIIPRVNELNKKVTVVIPTLNEGDSIKVIIKELESLKLAKVIFADSSTDGSDHIIRNLSEDNPKIHLVRVKRLGLGNGIREGLSEAVSLGSELIVTMDADMSHNPQYIPEMVQQSDKFDIVIGSRNVPNSRIIGWGPRRILMSRVANIISHGILRISAKDCSSGFRCYNRRVLLKILPLSFEEGYSIQSELLLLSNRYNFSITEVPIVFVNRKSGKSKLKFEEVVRFLSFFVRILRKRELRITNS